PWQGAGLSVVAAWSGCPSCQGLVSSPGYDWRGQQQWAAKVLPMVVGPLSSVNPPTAQRLLAEDAATANSQFLVPMLALPACAHWVPFQCRIRESSVVPLTWLPTAQVLSAAVVAAPYRTLLPVGVGLACWTHVVPFPFWVRISALS